MYNWKMFEPILIPDYFDTGYDPKNQHLKVYGSGKENMDIDFVARVYELFIRMKDYNFARTFISSAYRSPEYNLAIGGAKNSYHTNGLAVDIYSVTEFDLNISNKLFELANEIYGNDSGIGIYVQKPVDGKSHKFIHFEMRGTKKRWGRLYGKYVDFDNQELQEKFFG